MSESITEQIAALDCITIRSEESAHKALVSVLVSVSEVNASLAADENWRDSGILDHLREWLEKLMEKLREIVERFQGSSFSISVAGPVPPSVSVAVNFAH